MSIASEISRIKNNIASAYSACESKGAAMPQQKDSSNLADAIESITVGIGSGESKVKFYDIDGTVLHEYTEEKAAELTALPALPAHDGLDAISWSWTLQDIQSELNVNHGNIAVGCFFKTSDGKTKLHICLEDSDTFSFVMIQSGENQAEIDWGDGSSPETLSVVYSTGNNRKGYIATHQYAPSSYPAEYIINISLIGDGWYGFGSNNYSNLSICNGNRKYGKMIRRIYLAENVSVDGAAFCSAAGAEIITYTNAQAYGTKEKFKYCSGLKFSVIRGEAGISCFDGCYSLKAVSFCKGIISVDNYAFQNCYELENCLSLSACQEVGSYSFYACASIHGGVALPACGSIAQSAFLDCYGISSIAFSSQMSYLYREILKCQNNSSSLLEVDLTSFRDPDSLPYLEYPVTDIFETVNRYGRKVKYYVADATMKAAFSNATNWSSGGDNYVVKEASS